MKYIKILILLLTLQVSCSKEFLDRRPGDALVNSTFYQNEDQLLQTTAPLYSAVWQTYNFQAIQHTEQRANTLWANGNQFKNFRVSTTLDKLNETWQSFYNTVGQANLIIQSVNAYAPASLSTAAKNNAIAEARFMRGLAYSYLVQLFGEVPVIENNLTLLSDTTIARNTIESIWNFIIEDMRFASKNLFPSSPKPGRLNKYAGEAMLAKMFLTKAGVGMPGDGSRRQIDLDSAAYYSRSVIANGPYKLMENYEDLYLLKNNNNVESIFALQWVFNREWGTANALQSFLAFSSGITGVGDGWGSQWGAGLNTLQLYEDLAKDKRRKATYMFPGDKYDYITYELNGVKKPLVVPFTADGNYTRGYSDYAWIKKYVIGRPEDNNGQVLFMNTGNNTYMMRFAEVYLTLAEAILGNAASTSDAEAVGAVNKIRVRAGLQPVTQITWYDIYRERMLEFAMENMSTFDYARLHSYNPQKAYKMLSEMNRGYYRIRVQPNINNPVSWTVEERAGNETDRYTNVNATNFYLPIPQAEQIRAPNLLKPPVPYISGSN